MKNVCLYIIFLLIGFNNFGQDLQNANWLYGENLGLTFLPNINAPVNIYGSQMVVYESTASVSDENGNLLFYTDGITVWNKNHIQMPNGTGLKSHGSNTQGAVIIPKPGFDNIYFIFTIDGISGSKRGLSYSEVDLSLDGGLGDIISSSKNTVLKDHNGIDIYYNNSSEKLTSTTHSNDVDYWLVAQIKDRIYSYLVTSSGITSTPTTVSMAPVNTDYLNDLGAGMGAMKISPNNEHIAICYTASQGSEYSKGRLAFGTFNNSTGSVVISPILITAPFQLTTFYGVEFSPSSNYIYFTTSFGLGSRRLYRITNTGGQFTEIANVNHVYGLQRAINNKIYVAVAYSSVLSVINNPDNINPDFQLNTSGPDPSSTSIGLPQWVHKQKCLDNLVLTVVNNVASGQDNRQVSNSITASNVINNGAVGIYHAGNYVVLKPGFHSANGSKFRGYIEGCSGQFVGLMAPEEEQSSRIGIEEVKSIFTLSPNPAKDRTTITSDFIMTQIEVKSLTGTVFFSGNVNDKSHDLYVGNYPKGFYLVMVTTDTGEVEVKKLIKD